MIIMVDTPLDSKQEIKDYLDALPPVAPRYRRVLRGQARLYDSIFPSEYRPSAARHPRKRLLKVAAKLIVDNLRGTQNDSPEDFLLWTELVAQQYSTGSPYLDVTTNLDVAVWFALNSFNATRTTLMLGLAGPYNPNTDLSANIDTYIPKQSGDEFGYLIVLDVLEPSGAIPQSHGQLIDLSELPPGIADSLRIKNQFAALVYSNKKVDGGNLSAFRRGEPIPISSRVGAEISDEINGAILFPGPASDPWYQRLLSIPLTLQAQLESDELALAQTIPVPLYLWDEASATEVSGEIIYIGTPTLSPDLRLTQIIDQESGGSRNLLPDDAVTILVEKPLYLTTPPIDSAMWSMQNAIQDLPKLAPVRKTSRAANSHVSLQRVYFEFSPLELSVWHLAENSDTESIFHSGAYVEREGDTFTMWRVARSFPSGEINAEGPFVYAFDDETHDFEVCLPDGTAFDPMSDPTRLKTLLVCLSILRNLSPEPIVDAVAAIRADDKFIFPLVGGAELLQKRFRQETVYLLRNPESEETFQRRLYEHGIEVRVQKPSTQKTTGQAG
jgi:hypothetical protein